MDQPTFFDGDPHAKGPDAERLVLYALGDFQARGLVLAGRDLPLDRLRGALRRSAEAHGVEALGDEQAVAALSALGASVRRVPARRSTACAPAPSRPTRRRWCCPSARR